MDKERKIKTQLLVYSQMFYLYFSLSDVDAEILQSEIKKTLC